MPFGWEVTPSGMEISVSPKRMLAGLSLCLDFVRKGLRRHHRRVASIALGIAGEMGLPPGEKDTVFLASLVHDVGVSTWQGKEALHQFEVENPWEHCRAGFELMSRVRLLEFLGAVILSHHDRYAGANDSGLSGEAIPLPARIIHLADRVDVLLGYDRHVLVGVGEVTGRIRSLAGRHFDPAVVEAFLALAGRESFWLGLSDALCLNRSLDNACTVGEVGLDEADMRQMARMFAQVIDKKSRFTRRHSQHVAAVAVTLAGALGFSREDVVLMELAALTHDLGKLSVPEEILEKPGPLTPEEYAVMRQHTFYTYVILNESGAPSPIPEWAAYHHERLDGNGYPFHLDAARLDTGARLMAVADVFAALREDRPYRPGMNRRRVEEVMRRMAAESALCGEIVGALFDAYDAVERAMAAGEDLDDAEGRRVRDDGAKTAAAPG